MPKGQRTSLQSIERKIEQLQAEADALKTKDKKTVIQRINEAIRHYGIEAADLTFTSRKIRRPEARSRVTEASQRARKPAIVKYRDGENTWAGRGKRPTWLNERLKSGARLEDFAV